MAGLYIDKDRYSIGRKRLTERTESRTLRGVSSSRLRGVFSGGRSKNFVVDRSPAVILELISAVRGKLAVLFEVLKDRENLCLLALFC